MQARADGHKRSEEDCSDDSPRAERCRQKGLSSVAGAVTGQLYSSSPGTTKVNDQAVAEPNKVIGNDSPVVSALGTPLADPLMYG
jgi:hypothetical protein